MPLATQWMRRFMLPLRCTPLHPQWLVFRGESSTHRWIQRKAHGSVLDIGCADGWARSCISSSCDYIGLDYPGTAHGLYHTRPDIFADGALLPFQDESFDTVLLLEVLEHVSRPGRVLTEIQRVLRPGGTLLLSMPFLYPLHDAPYDYQRYTSPGLIHALQDVGLDPSEPRPRNQGFEVAGLQCSIACAEALLSALRERRWRLLLAPVLVVAIPIVNVFAWILSPLSGKHMLASGYAVEARKP